MDTAPRNKGSYCHRGGVLASSRRQVVSPTPPSFGDLGKVRTPGSSGTLPASLTRGFFSRLPPVGVEKPPFSPGSSGEGGQTGDLTTFLPPCGAKLRGSGGAPPTNLILLRNQRPRQVQRRSARARPVRPRPAPATRPAAVPRPRPPVVFGESFRLPFHASGVGVALTQRGE